MPLYYLYKRTTGNPAWNYSGWQLQVTGSPNNVTVNARTWSQTPPPNPGDWQTVTGATERGNPNSPDPGDTLTLPPTVGGVTDIVGAGTYASSGDKGAGYYTDLGPEEEEGDWCAGSN